LEPAEVLCKSKDEILQHGDGHIFTEAETNFGIAPEASTFHGVAIGLIVLSVGVGRIRPLLPRRFL
jgi:hypothetical protein